jgi:phosphoesterase RecJ-like protein
MMTEISITAVAEFLSKNDSYIVLSHTNPDGDTVGAGVGLTLLLEKMGKKVKALVCDKEIPEYLRFIKGSERYVLDFEAEVGDTVVAVDTASPQMLGALAEKFTNITELRIDHHEVSTPFAKNNCCIFKASSCCEIIADLSSIVGVSTPDMATALLCGIMTDSGSFRYSSTGASTHRCAAYLMDVGADLDYISASLYESRDLSSLMATSYAVTKMKMCMDKRIAYSTISNHEKEQLGLSDSDFSECASLMRQIKGVEAALFLREVTSGEYKLSMRSRESVDSAVICAVFGGGGHARAAGATVLGSDPDEIVKKIIKEVQKQLEDTK